MRPTQKSVRGWGFTAVLVLLVFSFVSCKYELVKEPTHNFNEKKNAADYNDYILPPKNITASQGLKCAVELEWEAVPNAVQYYIYSAATPYDTFQKVSETKADETEISIDEESGITKYYCVSAVNYYGTVSSKSIVVSGSTLAVPIITEITASEEGTCLTVNWWMDNCNRETYENSVSYNISVYKSVSSNVKVKAPVTVQGSTRSVVIDQLESKTEYFFTIEVVNAQTGDKEISTKTSAFTAHRVIPDPPEDLQITQGDSISKITVSWKLPNEAWYRTNEGSSGFELHPVFFKIYRKSDSQDFSFLAEQKFTDSYSVGVTVSYEDTNVERGKQYEYYIQSFTDKVPSGKVITADSSKSQIVKGWIISEPKFYIESEYTKSENGQIFTNITFNPKLSFETYGIEYKYAIGIKKQDLETSDEEQLTPKEFNSINEVNDFIDSFEDPANASGYYYYTLYIYPTEGEDYYIAADASGKYTVAADVNVIPSINNFTLLDGFSQSFELSWEYNPAYVYIIHWKDGENGEEQTEEIDASNFAGKVKGDTVTYSHAATSGDCRIYTLEASAGISTIVRPNNDTAENLYKTLGTPDIKIVSYEYNKIKVEWNAVQMASNTYTVSAHYENDDTELIPEENRTKTMAGDADTVSFEITEPEGYDNATISGKPIILSVTASSATRTDTITGFKDVCTLGPALTNTKVSQADENVIKNAISVEWDAVQGAQGYLIRRVCYKKGKTSIAADSTEIDTYYFDGTNLSVTSEPVDSGRAYVTPTDKGFILTDIAKEVQDDTKQYEINQSRISWGVPYDYFIIPVKADGIEPAIQYTNIPNNYIATYGYGLNIKAEKSDSSTTQVLEWDSPYITENNLPSFYYRVADSLSNTWTKISNVTVSNVSQGGNTKQATFVPKSTTEAYEYLVAYNKAFDTVDVPVSFLNDKDVGLCANENRTGYKYNENETEKANKGYLLAVNLYAGTGNGYSETVTWGAWDYSKRKIGPDRAQVFIKNYNISSNWMPFAELDKKLQFTTQKPLDNTTITKLDNVTVSLEPTEKMDKNNNLVVTTGYMQVLRDAKHYYKLELTRGDLTCLVGVDENNKETVYAYRNITDKELVKCALLNLAYGFYLDAGGKADLSNVNSQMKYGDNKPLVFEGSGSASFGKSYYLWGDAGKYGSDVSMSDFAPEMLTPGGEYTCGVKISLGPVSIRIHGLSDWYLDQFRTEGFTVKVSQTDNNMPQSYNKNLIVTCTSNKNLTVKIGNETIVQTNDANIRRTYFPIQLYNESDWYFKNSTYGWWPNANP